MIENELDDVQEKIKFPTKADLKNYYVSNKDLYDAYIKWYDAINAAVDAGKEPPNMPNYIGECIMKICKRLAFRPNFFAYSYRDDMIGDAIIKNVQKAKNFDITRSNNPFSYITTIAWNAFITRIKEENNESSVKGKLIEELDIEELFDMSDSSEESISMQQQYVDFLREHNCFISEKAGKIKVLEEVPGAFDEFFGDEEVE